MEKADRRQWTSHVAFILLLLFAGAADGLMNALGPTGFLIASSVMMGAAWRLVEVSA